MAVAIRPEADHQTQAASSSTPTPTPTPMASQRRICNWSPADGLTPAGNTCRETQAKHASLRVQTESTPSVSARAKLREDKDRPRVLTPETRSSPLVRVNSRLPITDSLTPLQLPTSRAGNRSLIMLTSEPTRTLRKLHQRTRNLFSGLAAFIREKISTREETHWDNGPKFFSITERSESRQI